MVDKIIRGEITLSTPGTSTPGASRGAGLTNQTDDFQTIAPGDGATADASFVQYDTDDYTVTTPNALQAPDSSLQGYYLVNGCIRLEATAPSSGAATIVISGIWGNHVQVVPWEEFVEGSGETGRSWAFTDFYDVGYLASIFVFNGLDVDLLIRGDVEVPYTRLAWQFVHALAPVGS